MRHLILTIVLILGTIISYGQSRHEFEILSGRAISLTEWDVSENAQSTGIIGRSVIGGAYRYGFSNGLRLGAKYLYSPNFSVFVGSKRQTHELILNGEYLFMRDKKCSPFLAVGTGPQYIYSKGKDEIHWGYQTLEAGLTMKSRWRATLGWYNGTESFAYFTFGWLF